MKKIILLFLLFSGLITAQKKKSLKQQKSWDVNCYLPTGENAQLNKVLANQ